MLHKILFIMVFLLFCTVSCGQRITQPQNDCINAPYGIQHTTYIYEGVVPHGKEVPVKDASGRIYKTTCDNGKFSNPKAVR